MRLIKVDLSLFTIPPQLTRVYGRVFRETEIDKYGYFIELPSDELQYRWIKSLSDLDSGVSRWPNRLTERVYFILESKSMDGNFHTSRVVGSYRLKRQAAGKLNNRNQQIFFAYIKSPTAYFGEFNYNNDDIWDVKHD